MNPFRTLCSVIGISIACLSSAAAALADDKNEENPPQYQFETIAIPPASADEPKLERVSVRKALDYLDQGALAWNGSRKCVTCHTNGTYMVVRPALSARVGAPNEEMRKHFLASLEQFSQKKPEEQQESVAPAQAIYMAAGLAEWDAHVAKKLSPETERALALMFSLQRESGTWGALDCWPPYESSAYHLATVAAMAVGTAPGWLDRPGDEKLRSGIERLKNYLRSETPKQDYDRTLLLWAAARLPGLLESGKRQELIEMVLKKQRSDGGWSIRSFGEPEQWGRGNRAEKLRSEPEFADPPSDGHQTGLALIVLRESGVPAGDARIQKGVNWLLANQRTSGRWWTRSLNTEKWHFITYSGTALPLLALSLCDALPNPESQAAGQ
ncbi:MAG TPA: prenyltransferase/squalene oxidase repeat-containing protein [Planctomycetaceae bacterium]|nr:prenyltransferase/squalene oxidase repeat-containing protein [Planctomycetaceae bacterium]